MIQSVQFQDHSLNIFCFFYRESIEIERQAKRQATSEAVVPRKSPRRNLVQDIAAAAGDD